jgi:hypothetical protein
MLATAWACVGNTLGIKLTLFHLHSLAVMLLFSLQLMDGCGAVFDGEKRCSK